MSSPNREAVPVAIRPRSRVMWRNEIALGPGKAELLALVGETGSSNEAAQRLAMSVGLGCQVAVTSKPTYNNNFLLTV